MIKKIEAQVEQRYQQLREYNEELTKKQVFDLMRYDIVSEHQYYEVAATNGAIDEKDNVSIIMRPRIFNSYRSSNECLDLLLETFDAFDLTPKISDDVNGYKLTEPETGIIIGGLSRSGPNEFECYRPNLMKFADVEDSDNDKVTINPPFFEVNGENDLAFIDVMKYFQILTAEKYIANIRSEKTIVKHIDHYKLNQASINLAEQKQEIRREYFQSNLYAEIFSKRLESKETPEMCYQILNNLYIEKKNFEKKETQQPKEVLETSTGNPTDSSQYSVFSSARRTLGNLVNKFYKR